MRYRGGAVAELVVLREDHDGASAGHKLAEDVGEVEGHLLQRHLDALAVLVLLRTGQVVQSLKKGRGKAAST